MEERLGTIAMRIIGGALVLAIAAVLASKGVEGFPYGTIGLVGAAVLAAVSFAVGQVR